MQPFKSQRDDVPPGPLAERTLERWIGVEGVQVPLAPQAGGRSGSTSRRATGDSPIGRDEPAPHWSAHIETWFFRFAVVATVVAVLYVAVSTLLRFGVVG